MKDLIRWFGISLLLVVPILALAQATAPAKPDAAPAATQSAPMPHDHAMQSHHHADAKDQKSMEMYGMDGCCCCYGMKHGEQASGDGPMCHRMKMMGDEAKDNDKDKDKGKKDADSTAAAPEHHHAGAGEKSSEMHGMDGGCCCGMKHSEQAAGEGPMCHHMKMMSDKDKKDAGSTATAPEHHHHAAAGEKSGEMHGMDGGCYCSGIKHGAQAAGEGPMCHRMKMMGDKDKKDAGSTATAPEHHHHAAGGEKSGEMHGMDGGCCCGGMKHEASAQ